MSAAAKAAAVLAEVAAIPKSRLADPAMGGFAFRGIDDVLAALHPVFARHGLFLRPTVTDTSRTEVVVETRGGRRVRVDVAVTVAFDAVDGETGEAVNIGTVVGEGSAFDDKATAKAMSSALKTLAFQAFLIPTDAAVDTESEDTSGDEFTAATREQVAELKRLVKAIRAAGGAGEWDKWKRRHNFRASDVADGKVSAETMAHAIEAAAALADVLETDSGGGGDQ
ncbi:MAG: hypothetical protein D6683_03935 [Actinomyces sp.]|nr:MAG: hypothetical protein D6683_03935 [Actinomyces sp.]